MRDKDTQLLKEAYNKVGLFATLTPEEINFLKAFVNGEEDLYSEPELMEKLYDYYWEEIPYGIAKARTGDPDQWFYDKLSTLFNKELKTEATTYWDDIPYKIQKKIYKLEKMLDDLEQSRKLGNKSVEVLNSIKNIKNDIKKLEAPYTR